MLINRKILAIKYDVGFEYTKSITLKALFTRKHPFQVIEKQLIN
jgi:hypothetical protein